MAGITFIKQADAKFSVQLTRFADKIGDYATTLNLSTDDIDSIKADAKYKLWKPDGPFIRPKKCVVRSNYTIDQVFGNDEAIKDRFKEIKDDSFHIDALLLF